MSTRTTGRRKKEGERLRPGGVKQPTKVAEQGLGESRTAGGRTLESPALCRLQARSGGIAARSLLKDESKQALVQSGRRLRLCFMCTPFVIMLTCAGVISPNRKYVYYIK